LKLVSPLGDAAVRVEARETLAGEPQVDAALVTVKLGDTEAGMAAARAAIGAETRVISFQNGVESHAVIAPHAASARVLPGAAYIGAEVASPGVVRHFGTLARFVFGSIDGARDSGAEAVLAAFKAAGIDSHIPGDIVRVLWAKFVFLAALSGVGAAARATTDRIARTPELRATFRAAMAETYALARARGIALPADLLDRHVDVLDTMPAGQKASMLQDLEAGKKLELSWLVGAVARMGAASGVATPVNATLAAVLEPFREGAR
jgi:2-dehydropantoate 2-reductase